MGQHLVRFVRTLPSADCDKEALSPAGHYHGGNNGFKLPLLAITASFIMNTNVRCIYGGTRSPY